MRKKNEYAANWDARQLPPSKPGQRANTLAQPIPRTGDAGDSSTIACTLFHWWAACCPQRVKDLSGGDLADTPATDRWLQAVGARPAVRKVMTAS